MVRSSLIALVLLIFAISNPVKAEPSDQTLKLEHFIRCMCHVADLEMSPSFSPDGKQISFISDISGTKQVWTIPIESGFPQLVTIGETSVPHVQWSPIDPNILVYSTYPKGSHYYQIYRINPKGTDLVRLSSGGKTINFGATFTSDGKQLLVTSDSRSGKMEPCLINPKTGSVNWIFPGSSSIAFYDFSKDGKYALLSESNSFQAGAPFLLNMKTKKRTNLFTEAQQFYGKFGPDGKKLYVVTRSNRNRSVLGTLDIKLDGTTDDMKVIASRPDADIVYSTGWDLVDNLGKRAVIVWTINDKTELEILGLNTGKSTYFRNLPGNVSEPKFSKDGNLLVFRMGGPFLPDNLWYLNFATGKIKQITFFTHPGINFKMFVRPEFVTFKSFDNLELSGWLYRPNTASKTAPYVIDFHGGSESRSSPSRKYQPLLSQGIGVLAPNVRGSSGKGKAFASLDDGPLRVNAIKDIKASYDFLVNNEIADSKKIGISGHSMGGFMTLAGMIKYPKLFAAGAADNGPVNLVSMLKERKKSGSKLIEIGDLAKDIEVLTKISPALNSEKIIRPVLIQQGESDFFTADVEKMVKKMKKRKARVDYVVYSNEGHNLYKIDNRIQLELKKVLFFVEHLKSGNLN